MAREVLADGMPIRRFQLREFRRRGVKLTGGHHKGTPPNPNGPLRRIRRARLRNLNS